MLQPQGLSLNLSPGRPDRHGYNRNAAAGIVSARLGTCRKRQLCGTGSLA
jgi:hypothetical protein